MKKLYAIVAAFATIISASAIEPVQALDTYKAPTKIAKHVTLPNLGTEAMLKPYAAETTDLSIEALAGEYDWIYYSYLTDQATGQAQGATKSVVGIEIADKAAGKVIMTLGNTFALEGTYDAATATLTVAANQDLGFNEYNQMQVYCYHMRWNTDGNGRNEVSDPFTFKFDGNALTLPLTEGTGNIAGQMVDLEIIAIGNSAKGWFIFAGDNEISAKIPYADRMPEGTWKSIGKGTFTDGWQVIEYLGVPDYTETTWEVEVEQNESNSSLYRIVNPYGTKTDSPLADINDDENNGEGYIVFSVENPEYVIAYPYIYSGLEDADGAYINYNLEGFCTILNELPAETVIANKDKLGITEFSTYKDGKVTFKNCVFATKSEPEATYTWQDQAGNALVGASYLEIDLSTSGIEDIISSDNTQAEYFNLKGMRVDTPAAGQVVIKRQGNKATKIVVK